MYANFDGRLEEKSSSWISMFGHSNLNYSKLLWFQPLDMQRSRSWGVLGGGFENISLKGFWKRHEGTYDDSRSIHGEHAHIHVMQEHHYFFSLVLKTPTLKWALRHPIIHWWENMVNLHENQYALNRLTNGFQWQHAHLPSSWLVTQATFLSQHMIKLYIKT